MFEVKHNADIAPALPVMHVAHVLTPCWRFRLIGLRLDHSMKGLLSSAASVSAAVDASSLGEVQETSLPAALLNLTPFNPSYVGYLHDDGTCAL